MPISRPNKSGGLSDVEHEGETEAERTERYAQSGTVGRSEWS